VKKTASQRGGATKLEKNRIDVKKTASRWVKGIKKKKNKSRTGQFRKVPLKKLGMKKIVRNEKGRVYIQNGR